MSDFFLAAVQSVGLFCRRTPECRIYAGYGPVASDSFLRKQPECRILCAPAKRVSDFLKQVCNIIAPRFSDILTFLKQFSCSCLCYRFELSSSGKVLA